MEIGGLGWGLQTIVGVILLATVLMWALVRNRASRADVDDTERATRELYRAEEEARSSSDDAHS